MALEKTLESPLNSKEIKSILKEINPKILERTDAEVEALILLSNALDLYAHFSPQPGITGN